jgi:hypothetical protein
VLRPAPEGFKICCAKACSHNGEPQLIANFAKSRRRVDGLHHTCKDCVKDAAQKRKHRNAEKFSDRSILYPEGKMKICSRADCVHKGEEQPVTNYYKHLPSYDGLSPECKDCAMVQNEKWRSENVEYLKKIKKEYSEKNSEKSKEYHRQYHAKVKRNFRIENWAEVKIVEIKRRSTRKGLPFNIDPSDLSPLPKFCSVFGIELDYTGGNDRRYWASVDRIKPELGYVKGNVRIISMAANAAKFDGDGDLITKSTLTN